MPTFSYQLYQRSDLVFTGSSINLVSDHHNSNNVVLEIIDDDTLLDGDVFRNDDGNDTNQFGTATFPDGTTVGSTTTTVYSEQQYTLTAPDGSTIFLHEVEIDSNPSSNTGAGIRVGYLPSSPLTPGLEYGFTLSNTTSSNTPDYTSLTGVLCFASLTKIETSKGIVRIDDIRPGDLVETATGLKPVRWIGSQTFTAEAFAQNPKLRPVRITAGAMGHNLPQRDLLVSRQHRMVICSKITNRMFGEDEILIPAIKLTDHPGIYVDDFVGSVEYFHMMFDQHEIVYAEGSRSESLFVGPEALKTLTAEMRKEIHLIFPELQDQDALPKLARRVPDLKRQKKCVARHIKSGQPFLSTSASNSR